MSDGNLQKLLQLTAGKELAGRLFQVLVIPENLLNEQQERVSRACIAQALNMLLFADLLDRVPAARTYLDHCISHNHKVFHDHGAVRTVALEGMGTLPAGQTAITRILEPLGYILNGLYPLERLRMTGRSWAHQDDRENIAQFFISELHPEQFSQGFQAATKRVTSESKDPLTSSTKALLKELAYEKSLAHQQAAELLPAIVAAFGRQHPDPYVADYEELLSESAEMAWISTEGNAFNHVTDRVEDVDKLAEEQKALGQPMKQVVEKSQSGRVRQTAFHAARVLRKMRTPDGTLVEREVPGSFLEFITRLPMPDEMGIDLSFDSSNAQAIFKMTANAHASV